MKKEKGRKKIYFPETADGFFPSWTGESESRSSRFRTEKERESHIQNLLKSDPKLDEYTLRKLTPRSEVSFYADMVEEGCISENYNPQLHGKAITNDQIKEELKRRKLEKQKA